MRPYEFADFASAIQQMEYQLQFRSHLVHSDHWQGADIRNKPEMATREITHVSFQVPMSYKGLDEYRQDINPNLPWADDHFEERVSGQPMNPGLQWAKWPYGNSAAKFLDERGMFNHNYMERYWPKTAGLVQRPTRDAREYEYYKEEREKLDGPYLNKGIMYSYGDLNDLVQLLAKDPYTRQAYLPIFFPEDTGGGNKRAPCTIGYHFLMRDGRLDINYHIRSCDFIRHFRDDIYLTARLALWVLERCREIDPLWNDVYPGKFIMQIGSLHMFRNDWQQHFKGMQNAD